MCSKRFEIASNARVSLAFYSSAFMLTFETPNYAPRARGRGTKTVENTREPPPSPPPLCDTKKAEKTVERVLVFDQNLLASVIQRGVFLDFV